MESYVTAAQVYAAGLVFARIGAMVMLVPGLGDASVPPRIRLAFALLVFLPLMGALMGGFMNQIAARISAM